MNESEAGDAAARPQRSNGQPPARDRAPSEPGPYQRHDAYRHPEDATDDDEAGSRRQKRQASGERDSNEGADDEADSDDDEGDDDDGDDADGDKDDKDDKGENGDKGDGKKKKKSPLKNPKVRIGLVLAAIVLLVGFAIWFHHYWTIGRFQQSTNDAYLQADQVTVSPKVPGYIEQVFVQDNQNVRAGDPLVQIDPRDTRDQAAQAQAQVDQGLASIVSTEAQIRQQRAQIAAADAQTVGARRALEHAQASADRYVPLTAEGAHSQQELEQILQQRDQAVAQLQVNAAQADAARRQVATLRAQVGTARAQIEAAEATLRRARVDLASTTVRASIDGRVGDRTVRLGQYVQPGTKLMSVVPVSEVYLVANFKETQVGLMRIGQPATIEVDALSGATLQGRVQSFSPGTGAQFALLPPQNATGNFTKVVQRVPVRITIEAGEDARKVLVPGLSVDVSVNTLGAKETRDRAEDESKAREDQRKREDAAAIQSGRQRGREGELRGPGG